jgi:hypothetical protein
MAKKGDSQAVTQTLDPKALAYRDKIFGAASNAAQQPLTQYNGQEVAGPSSLTTDAAGGYQHGAGLFGLGVDAMSGDADAFSKFYNPYQSNVLDAITRQAQRGRYSCSHGHRRSGRPRGRFRRRSPRRR